VRRKKLENNGPPASTQEMVVLHDSVPHIAFELALYRMRNTNDPTHNILTDYLKELGA